MQLSIKLVALTLMAAYVTAQDTTADPNALPSDLTSAASSILSQTSSIASQLSSLQSSVISSMASASSSSVESSASAAISSLVSQVSTAIRPTGTSNSGGDSRASGVGGGAALALMGFVAALV